MKRKTGNFKNTKESTTIYIPFFAGLIFNLFVILMFAKTIIRLQDIFMMYITTGIVFYFIFGKFVKMKLSKFYRLVYTTVSFGSILASLLLSINLYIYPANDFEILKTEILKKGFTTKGKHPTADIKLDGITKGIVFLKLDDINDYSGVKVKVREGILGWKIIEKITLIR